MPFVTPSIRAKSKVASPFMYDDMPVEQSTGQTGKGGLPVESLKLLLEAQRSTSLPARFKDD